MIYGSWDKEHEIEFLSLSHFLPFYPTNNLKNLNFEKMKKTNSWRYHHFTLMHRTWRSYHVWFLRYVARQTEFFFFFDHFLSFYSPLQHRKSKSWKKRKKHLEILPFYTCTINENHLMYGSWDRQRERQNFFHFGPFFAFLSQKQPEKSKFWKHEKNLWIYHHFTLVYQKSWSYAMLFLRYSAWRMIFIFHFGLFFVLLPPDSPKNQN